MKKIISEIRYGIDCYREAHRIIREHRLWLFVILPGVINLLLFAVTFYFGWIYSDILTSQIMGFINITNNDGSFVHILQKVLAFVILFVLRLLFIILYLYIYKYVILILMSPVLAWLSERTEEIITGRKYPFNPVQFSRDVLRGVCIAVRNLVIQSLILLLCFLLGFVPVLGLIAPLPAFLAECYFYGFSLMDYSNERHKLTVRESVSFINSHFTLSATLGGGFYLLMMIPVAGIIIAPAYSAIAATVAVCRRREDGNRFTA
ncbi:MAG: EI24 domain-containing protein [Bacteroidetes bacterium]|nr:EI24 domain-containing protein [Bacteroidota bacterium]